MKWRERWGTEFVGGWTKGSVVKVNFTDLTRCFPWRSLHKDTDRK